MQDGDRFKCYDRLQKAIHDKPATPNDVSMFYNSYDVLNDSSIVAHKKITRLLSTPWPSIRWMPKCNPWDLDVPFMSVTFLDDPLLRHGCHQVH